jgi:DNA-binding transcriptional LysR family regulator
MDWDKMRVFHAVAEAGSFTHAGDALNLSQSAVSRQIGALEASLNTTLFHRHARGLVLTEQGEMLYRTAHEVLAKVAFTEALLADSKDKPSGELKVTTTVALGSIWLAPRIKEFLEIYPDIMVTLLLDDAELDLSKRDADVAIRMRQPVQSDLVHRKLITVHYHIYAAPDYLRRHGTPRTLEDLGKHRLVVYGDNAPTALADLNWLVSGEGKGIAPPRPALQINNIFGIKQAVQSGVGIGALPDYMVHGDNTLVRIMPDVPAPTFEAYLVYPEELRHTKRLAVFRDFLLRMVADWRF